MSASPPPCPAQSCPQFCHQPSPGASATTSVRPVKLLASSRAPLGVSAPGRSSGCPEALLNFPNKRWATVQNLESSSCLPCPSGRIPLNFPLPLSAAPTCSRTQITVISVWTSCTICRAWCKMNMGALAQKSGGTCS